MARRRFSTSPEAFTPEARSATLSSEETRHLRDVLRLKEGDEVYVFDGAGREFRCKIQTIARDSTDIKVIEEVEPARPESPLDLTLAVGLLKGEKFDLVVQKAVELGATSVAPVVTARADVRIRSAEDAQRKLIRWQRIALQATKQCGRARLMKVETPTTFSDLMKRSQEGDKLGVMFAERAGVSFETAMNGLSEKPCKLIAMIGSEGGFTDDEIDQARDVGWKIVTLGGRIMRAETAAIAIAALLQHRFGDLK